VLQAAPNFEKRSEILYRLGMIYKQQEQPASALDCFQQICDTPPAPLSQADVWFLIGTVQEVMPTPAPEFAKQAYEHVLRLMHMSNDTKTARVYRQLGWVCHKHRLDMPMAAPPALAQVMQSPILCLQHALENDSTDAQNWQLLSRCLLDHGEVEGAYDCLMHAVALDASSSETWVSVGAVYNARNQIGEAIAAYEHAVHLNPMSSCWYELGICRHQRLTDACAGGSALEPSSVTTAVEAYTRALAICPNNREEIHQRLEHLTALQETAANPSASAATVAAAATTTSLGPGAPTVASAAVSPGVADATPATAVSTAAAAVAPAAPATAVTAAAAATPASLVAVATSAATTSADVGATSDASTGAAAPAAFDVGCSGHAPQSASDVGASDGAEAAGNQPGPGLAAQPGQSDTTHDGDGHPPTELEGVVAPTSAAEPPCTEQAPSGAEAASQSEATAKLEMETPADGDEEKEAAEPMDVQ